MNSRKRPCPRPSPSPRHSGAAAKPTPADSVAEGRVVAVDPERGTARVALNDGRHLDARLPQHVSAEWLAAAVEFSPVEAAVARPRSGRAILWSVFPSPEHASVSIDVELSGRHVTLRASERLEIRCSRGAVVIDLQGNVTVRGKDLVSRATGSNRVVGGVVRLN